MLSVAAVAHENRPVYVELTEIFPREYQLQWKVPSSIPAANAPTVSLPRVCQTQSMSAEFHGHDGIVRRTHHRCPAGLTDQLLLIAYPGLNPSLSTLVRYNTVSGEHHVATLGPQQTSWRIPDAETPARVARQYTRLGIEHIWAGVDHLLFLTCLLWIAGTWQRIALTITGFTLAHSTTLVLSAVEVIRLPIPPIEAAIALSIVFVASEILKGQRHSLTWQYPVTASTAFGLLHGLGFAAALRETGLPQTELVTGLLFFNVGVEIGQLVFACAVISPVYLLRQLLARRWERVWKWALPRMVVAYCVGILGVFWLLERGSALWEMTNVP